jgi:hypothetical protein
MEKPIITNFQTLGTLLIQRYERYIPNAFDESMSIVQKVNKVIVYLDQIGELTNDVVDQWNTVMTWFLEEGLSEAVETQFNTLVESEEFVNLVGVALDEMNSATNSRLAGFELKIGQIETLKARNLYNLKGDGITDDTIGLQQYFNDGVNLGLVYLPFGTYLFTSKLTIPDGIRIVGEKGKTNQECTRLLYDGADDLAIEAVKLDGGQPTSFWGLAIENVSIVNKKWNALTMDYGTQGVGIKLNMVSEGYFNNFQVTGFKIGILSAQANICDFNKCYVTSNQYGLWLGYKDLNGVNLGASEMNNFKSTNFWNNQTHVVLGGEGNFFDGTHMEQAKNVFLLNSKYSASCNNFEFRNGNIRNGNYGLTDHTNSILLNIVEETGFPIAIYTKLKFENSNVRLYGSNTAINVGLLDANGAKGIDVTLSDMDIYGIQRVLDSPNFDFTNLSIRGRSVFKTDFLGAVSNSIITNDSIATYGLSNGVRKNVLYGALTLGKEQSGNPEKGDLWFDFTFNVMRLFNGMQVEHIEQLKVGTMSERPSTLFVGRQYFDTDLNKLIIHKGAGVWVDSMGVVV